MKIDELELLRADAEGKPDYIDEVICYSEALRNAALALIAVVKAAEYFRNSEQMREVFKALDEVNLCST